MSLSGNKGGLEIMSEECCPVFDPIPWDGKIFEWKDKKFIRDQIRTFFFIPLNFGKVIPRMNARVESVGASIPDRL